jgi:hypothetical protein
VAQPVPLRRRGGGGRRYRRWPAGWRHRGAGAEATSSNTERRAVTSAGARSAGDGPGATGAWRLGAHRGEAAGGSWRRRSPRAAGAPAAGCRRQPGRTRIGGSCTALQRAAGWRVPPPAVAGRDPAPAERGAGASPEGSHRCRGWSAPRERATQVEWEPPCPRSQRGHAAPSARAPVELARRCVVHVVVIGIGAGRGPERRPVRPGGGGCPPPGVVVGFSHPPLRTPPASAAHSPRQHRQACWYHRDCDPRPHRVGGAA